MRKPTIWTIKMPDDTLSKWVKLEDYDRLKAENSYLKGEECPYAELGSMMPKYLLEHWIKENARLKAEVERLTNENGNNSFMKEEWYLKCMSARAEVERLTEALKDEQAVSGHRADVIERLRKAGDAFEQALQDNPSTLYHIVQCVRAWNAAKEGKQP